MNDQENQLNALSDIRNLMDRSSRFISLSGLSGVFAGVTALLGAYLANVEIQRFVRLKRPADYYDYAGYDHMDLEANLIKIAFFVLIIALMGGVFFTYRQGKKKNLPLWDRTSKNLLLNLGIPLVAGGFFIIALLFNSLGAYGLIAPVCLVFYGLALVNASKYTYSDIRFLGLCEIILGIVALFNIGYGLYFWAFGFGVLHIVYGLVMYFKYEKTKS